MAGSQRINVGDIVLVDYPYDENDGRSKNRPAFVVEVSKTTYTLIPITSQLKYEGQPCYIRIDLRKPSLINVCKYLRVAHSHPLVKLNEEVSKLQSQLIVNRFRSALKSD